jgi:stage V sporulation protein AE
MFDDRGKCGKNQGEYALEFVASHPDVEVLGAVAVASNTPGEEVTADICIDSKGHILKDKAVDKTGERQQDNSKGALIAGDTVNVLNNLNVPLIVGVGDIGKMDRADDISRGCPITRKAIEEILRKNGVNWGG